MSTTYQITADTNDKVAKVVAFLKENPDISYTAVSYNTHPYSNECNYVPNSEFVGLCGSENLTKDGCISEATAVAVLLTYAKQNRLYFDTHIELNQYLRDVLKTEDNLITIHEISRHLKKIFKQVF